MAEKKQAPATFEKQWKNVVSAKMGLARKKINLTEDRKPWKPIGKTTFWAHTTTWQKKNKPRDAMETAGTLQKTLEKQRVAAGAPREMEWLAGGHLGNLTEDGKPWKTIGKTTFWGRSTNVCLILRRGSGSFGEPELKLGSLENSIPEKRKTLPWGKPVKKAWRRKFTYWNRDYDPCLALRWSRGSPPEFVVCGLFEYSSSYVICIYMYIYIYTGLSTLKQNSAKSL